MTIRDLLRSLPVFDRPLPAFDTESVPGEPSALFLSWLHEAIDAGVSEPHAMTLSTVDAEGRPDARVLILKDVDPTRWQFATAAISAKGTQLAARPHAALSFHWTTFLLLYRPVKYVQYIKIFAPYLIAIYPYSRDLDLTRTPSICRLYKIKMY